MNTEIKAKLMLSVIIQNKNEIGLTSYEISKYYQDSFVRMKFGKINV